jgi:hypothetical protein
MSKKPVTTKAEAEKARLIEMLQTPEGATLDEIVAALQWA